MSSAFKYLKLEYHAQSEVMSSLMVWDDILLRTGRLLAKGLERNRVEKMMVDYESLVDGGGNELASETD